jgi:hypothetical protein
VTKGQYDLGEHYDLAEQQLEGGGFERPWVHFDGKEAPKWLLAQFPGKS